MLELFFPSVSCEQSRVVCHELLVDGFDRFLAEYTLVLLLLLRPLLGSHSLGARKPVCKLYSFADLIGSFQLILQAESREIVAIRDLRILTHRLGSRLLFLQSYWVVH